MTDEQRLLVEPEDISGFGSTGCNDVGERRNGEAQTICALVLAFGNTIGFAGTHDDQAEVGGERSVVGVDRVEGKFWRGCEFDDFRSGSREFAAERVMLRLSRCEVGRMMKAEIAPPRDAFRLVPSSGARGGHQHALERADHGVSVKSEAGLGRCGQGVSFIYLSER